MSAKTEFCPITRGGEYTCVILSAKHYLAAYITPFKLQVLSKNPETDRSIAALTAATFANVKSIPFNNEPVQLIKPMVTILRSSGGDWYPAEIHPDKITFMKDYPSNGSVEAWKTANIIATQKGAFFVPTIGLSLVTSCPLGDNILTASIFEGHQNN